MPAETHLKIRINAQTKKRLQRAAFNNDTNMTEYVRRLIYENVPVELQPLFVVQTLPIDWNWENLQTPEQHLAKNLTNKEDLQELHESVKTLIEQQPKYAEGGLSETIKVIWLPTTEIDNASFVPCLTWKTNNKGNTYFAIDLQNANVLSRIFPESEAEHQIWGEQNDTHSAPNNSLNFRQQLEKLLNAPQTT